MSDEDDDEQILDDGSPIRAGKHIHDDRLLDTGHNRQRIQMGPKGPIRGEESQVMSVDCTYQNAHGYEEAKGLHLR